MSQNVPSFSLAPHPSGKKNVFENFQKMSFSQTFFSKSIIFQIPKSHGNENLDKGLLSPKNSSILPTHVSSYSCPKSQIFSLFLFLFAVITATPRYKFALKYQIWKPLISYNSTANFQVYLINSLQMAGFSIFSDFF